MSNSRKGFWAIVAIIVIIVVAVFAVYTFNNSSQQPTSQTGGSTQNIQAVFTCDGGKSINAVFMNASSSTTTGNSVQLSLSDGRQMTLPQVISADGARYANADQSFVFWNVGNGATVWENNTETYTNCTTQSQ